MIPFVIAIIIPPLTIIVIHRSYSSLGGGEDIGSVTHRVATLMNEFQFLHQYNIIIINEIRIIRRKKGLSKERKRWTNSAFVEWEKVGDEELSVEKVQTQSPPLIAPLTQFLLLIPFSILMTSKQNKMTTF